MCLIVFSVTKEQSLDHQNPKYSFLLMANRDEYYDRPTNPMDWWKGNNFLAGKDGLAGGTWLGVARDGRFAAITNYKEENADKTFEVSRGRLVADYLKSQGLKGKDYLKAVEGEKYAGFNLLVGDSSGIHCYANRRKGITTLTEGIHALGNRFLNSETKKVIKVKEDFKELVSVGIEEENSFEMMSRESGELKNITQDELRNNDKEEIPYRFIKSDIYGTRCTTFLAIDKSGRVIVSEQTYAKHGKTGSRKDFKFSI